MEVQPIVKHQSADKRVGRESQPTDEVCEKHNPLMGLWGRDDLSLGRETVNYLLGQVSGLSELLDVFPLNSGGIHLPLALDPDMVGVLSPAGEARAWALELKNGWAEEGEGRGE